MIKSSDCQQIDVAADMVLRRQVPRLGPNFHEMVKDGQMEFQGQENTKCSECSLHWLLCHHENRVPTVSQDEKVLLDE